MTHRFKSTLIAAIGSCHADDQAGWLVADRLASELQPEIKIRKASIPLTILDWLDHVDSLHIIDACEGGGAIGQLLHIIWPFDCGTILRAAGTHDFDIPSVLQLAEKLNRLPRSVTIWAIVGQNFSAEHSISTKVQARIVPIAQTIGKEINDARAITGAVASSPS